MMVKILLSVLVCLAANAALADLAHNVRCREIGFSHSAEVRDIQDFRSFIDADARFVSNEVLRGVDAIAEALAAKILDLDLAPLPEDSQAIIDQIDILPNSYNYIVGDFKREPPYLRVGIPKHMQNAHAITVQTINNYREKIHMAVSTLYL